MSTEQGAQFQRQASARSCGRGRWCCRRVSGQFALLGQRRFAPFFWTQFLGAGNDNLFKFAFTVLVTYQLQVSWLPPTQAGLVIGALFILPFLLFSATSGQLADKYDKARLIRCIKTLEIAIMALAAVGLLARRRGAAARLHLPDGPALDAVRAGQVRLPAAAPERARTDRRQRHGRDGDLRRDPARQRRRRAADRAAARSARSPCASACVALALLGRPPRSAFRPARRPIPNCASTGIRSPRPGATCARARQTWWYSARCSASRGCGSSARCSWRSFRRSQGGAAWRRAAWPRCCWWCSRSASASARCCARC